MTYHVPPHGDAAGAPGGACRSCRSFSICKARASSSSAAAMPWPGRRSCSRPSGAKVSVYARRRFARSSPSLVESGALTSRRAARAGATPISTTPGSSIAEGGDPEEAARLSAAARSRGVLVNVIDQPALCDFQFGTIVNRAPVVIGISTDGAAPILGQAIRRRIEAVLPGSIGAWASGREGVSRATEGNPRHRAKAAAASGRNSSTSRSSRRRKRTRASPSLSGSRSEISAERGRAENRRGRSSSEPGRAIPNC